MLTLIYPKKLNNTTEIFAVNLEKDGLYERIHKKMELSRNQGYIFGFPANENIQYLNISEEYISINDSYYLIEEGLSIVFVKKVSNIEQKQQIINNSTKWTSKKHAQIKVEQGIIHIYDGFENEESANGVWVLIQHQKLTLNSTYCFKDFRLLISLKY